MEGDTKFNFMPVKATWKKSNRKPTVTINKKKQIFFSNAYIQKYGADGRFIKFYADVSKKTLGWHLKNSVTDFKELKIRENRQIKRNKVGVATLQIKSVLEELKLPDKDYKQLEVNVFHDLLFGTIHYVQLY